MAYHKTFSGAPLSALSDDSLSVASAPLAPTPYGKPPGARAYVCQYAGCNRTYINEHSRRQHYRRSHRTRQSTETNMHIPLTVPTPVPKVLIAGKPRAYSEPNIEPAEDRVWNTPHIPQPTQQPRTLIPTQPHTPTTPSGVQLHSDKRRPFQRSFSSPNVGPSPISHPYASNRHQHALVRNNHPHEYEDSLQTANETRRHSEMHVASHRHPNTWLRQDDQLPKDLKDLPDTVFDFHPQGPQSTFSLDSLVGQRNSAWGHKYNRMGFERKNSRGDDEQRYTPFEQGGRQADYARRGGGSERIWPDPDGLSGHRAGQLAENESDTWMELEVFRNELESILGAGEVGVDPIRKKW